jgi:transposase
MDRKFKTVDYAAILQEPVLLSECVPEGHLARFVVEAIAQLDMTVFYERYGARGGEAIAPEILTGILIYGYASGVFSSRKLDYILITIRWRTFARRLEVRYKGCLCKCLN